MVGYVDTVEFDHFNLIFRTMYMINRSKHLKKIFKKQYYNGIQTSVSDCLSTWCLMLMINDDNDDDDDEVSLWKQFKLAK